MTPQRFALVTPATCIRAAFRGERDLGDVIKDLDGEMIPLLQVGPVLLREAV